MTEDEDLNNKPQSRVMIIFIYFCVYVFQTDKKYQILNKQVQDCIPFCS